MRDAWYADKRDLVKWAGITHLCSIEMIKNIVYVAYYRRNEWSTLLFDGADITLEQQVLNHFRNLRDIDRLAGRMGLNIKVIEREFDHATRMDYTQKVLDEIRTISQRKVVFLDPDVGIAVGRCKAQHVKPEEVTMFWRSLNPQDFLVLYQHRFRSSDWMERSRSQFAAACGVKTNRVKVWLAKQIAHDLVLAKDVVCFFIRKVV